MKRCRIDPAATKILASVHPDRVFCSGAFDGQAGIACPLEAARLPAQVGRSLQGGVDAAATVMEGGARFHPIGQTVSHIPQRTRPRLRSTAAHLPLLLFTRPFAHGIIT